MKPSLSSTSKLFAALNKGMTEVLEGFATILIGLFLIDGAIISQTAWGRSPYSLSYGGRLTNSFGESIKGPVDLELKLFREASGGNPLPVSPIVKKSVELFDGVFQVDITELSAAEMHLVFAPNLATWVEVTDVTSKITYPRQRLSAVPYAFKVPTDNTEVLFDNDGRLTLGSIPMSKISGLDAALSQKTDSSKVYSINEISGLAAALASKADSSSMTLGGDVSGSLNNMTVNRIGGRAVPTPSAETFLKFDGSGFTWAQVLSPSNNGAVTASTYLAGQGEGSSSPTAGVLRAANAGGTNATGADMKISAGNGTGTGGSGKIVFETAPTSSAGTSSNTMVTRMTIAPNGNVGVGTTTPESKLQVQGAISSVVPSIYSPTGTSLNIDLATGNIHRISLASATGSVTVSLANPVAGASYLLVFLQGSTPRSVTLSGSPFKWKNGQPYAPTLTANATDVVTLLYDGSDYLGMYNANFQ